MKNRKNLENELQSLNTLLNVVETYQEVAALRIRKIRSTVLKTREYLDGLSSILSQVKVTYDSKASPTKLTFQVKKRMASAPDSLIGRTSEVYVLLSSNTMLYGDIIRRIYELFASDIADKDVDIIIVGRVGLRLFKASGINKEYQFFEVPDGLTDMEPLRGLVKYILEYDKVTVFYSQFKDIVVQNPIRVSITGDISEYDKISQDVSGRNLLPAEAVLYEPDVFTIMNFFQSEIISALFEQTVLESNLSKFASRMISMDSAVVNTKKRVNQVEFDYQRAKHLMYNKKQLGSYSSFSLWK